MTSEQQHAGQPAEAAPGADGFPPDSDDHHQQQGAPSAAPQTGWGPDAYPNSYGPPPYPPSGSGSPFVVPAVPQFGAPNGEAQVPGPASSSSRSASVGSASVGSASVGSASVGSASVGSASVPSGSARVPAPPAGATPPPPAPASAWAPPPVAEQPSAEGNPFGRPAAEPHPYRDAAPSAPAPQRQAPTPQGSTPQGSFPQAEAHPYRTDAHPYRPAGQSSGSASVPVPPSSPAQPGFTPGGPLPSRTDRAPFSGPGGPSTPDAPGGFNGFVTSSGSSAAPAGPLEPERAAPSHPQLGEHGLSTGSRPPGISAFGGQPSRVPGAALTGLPDVPPPDPEPDAGPARQTSNGLPVRGSSPQPGFPAPPSFPAPPGATPPGATPPGANPPGDAPAFPAQGGSGFGPSRGQDSGGFSQRGQDSRGVPVRGADSGAYPARGNDSGGFAAGTGAPAQAVAPPRAVAGHPSDGASVPQPRTPAEPPSPSAGSAAVGNAAQGGGVPAVGTARPVSASASVPVASRVSPTDGEDLPPANAGPKARVYGRPPQAEQAGAALPAPATPFAPPPGVNPFGPDSGRQASGAPVSGQPVSGQPVSGQPVSGQPVSGPAGAGPSGFGQSPFERPGQPRSAQPGAHQPNAHQPGGPQPATGWPGSAGPGFGARGPESAPPSGRATASARVTPPPVDAPPFMPGNSPAGPGTPSDFGNQPGNPSGRGTPFPDGGGAPYSEHTTDLAGRGRATDKPYVPAPALPSMHASPPAVDGFPPARPVEHDSGQRPPRPGRPQLGGVFPGPGGAGPDGPGSTGNRATVTPPGPAETSSWPSPAGGDQGRFDAFKPEGDATAAKKVDPPANIRMAPVLLAVIVVSAVVVGLAIGIVWLISRSSSDSSFSVSAGDCVKQNGEKAVEATCGDAGSFVVASIVDTREQCADPTQPYVLNPSGDGRSQVLCLKPSS